MGAGESEVVLRTSPSGESWMAGANGKGKGLSEPNSVRNGTTVYLGDAMEEGSVLAWVLFLTSRRNSAMFSLSTTVKCVIAHPLRKPMNHRPGGRNLGGNIR